MDDAYSGPQPGISDPILYRFSHSFLYVVASQIHKILCPYFQWFPISKTKKSAEQQIAINQLPVSSSASVSD